ncbi:MAG: hypothetical protein U0T84_11610 [Chitinophagales bacterium]
MKKFYNCLLGVSLLSTQLHAAEPDRWIALIQFARLEAAQLHKAAPHFPTYTTVKTDNQMLQFAAQRKAWMVAFPNEVGAFLKLEAIQKLNPSLVDLGLKKENEEAPKAFSNPFMKWIERSGMSQAELSAVAPHFPKVNPVVAVAVAENQFAAALSDWMVLYVKEYEAILNHPKLTASNPYYREYITVQSYSTDSAYLVFEPGKVEPQPQAFQSGNPSLDQVRYEQYLKAWYYRYYKVGYFKKYDPEHLDGYLKEKTDEENNQGTH